MCLHKRKIKNAKYLPNKKNGGIPPPIKDKRTLTVEVECGKCIECKKKKANEWRVRLGEEIKESKPLYVAMTLSLESWKELYEVVEKKGTAYEIENEIITLAVRRFLERWRKSEKKSVKHWFISELGGQNYEKIHLHGFIWTDKNNDFIREKWKYGFVWMHNENGGYINEKTINYITKYVTKTDEKHKNYNSKILCSNGIGKGYLNRTDKERNKYRQGETVETYKSEGGLKYNLPQYYRQKIYTDEEREKLWIEKMDKDDKYITGHKYKKEEYEKYIRDLKTARKENVIKGFGGSEIDRKEAEEEELRRRKIHEKILNEKQEEKEEITGITSEELTKNDWW